MHYPPSVREDADKDRSASDFRNAEYKVRSITCPHRYSATKVVIRQFVNNENA